MRIIASVASVVGSGDGGVWAQTLGLSDSYAVVEVEDTVPEAARERGMRILSELSDILKDRPESLDAIKNIACDARRKGARSAIILVPIGSVMYISLCGTGVVYLKRNDKLAKLVSGEGSISGKVRLGDTVLAATHSFEHVVSEDELAGSFDHLSAVDMAEKLSAMTHSGDRINTGACFIYQVADIVEGEYEGVEVRPAIHKRAAFPPVLSRRFFVKTVSRIRQLRSDAPKRIVSRIVGYRKNPKVVVSIAGIFLIVCAWILISGRLKQHDVNKQTGEAAVAADQASHLLEEGMALQELNPKKSRERLSEAQMMLEKYVHVDGISNADNIRELYDKISENLTVAQQKFSVEPEIFFDPTLVKSGAFISDIAHENSVLICMDTKNATLYKVVLPEKSGSIIAGGDFIGASSKLTTGGDTVYILKDSTVYTPPIGDEVKAHAVVKDTDKKWDTIASLDWYGGNIYLMDAGAQRIWKYVGDDDTFSGRREYLNPDVFPDLSQAVDMDINGYVWTAGRDGVIRKFSGGREAEFRLTDVEPAVSSDLKIYTDDSLADLYILDRGNHRVVRVTKEGEYVAQYLYPEEQKPTELVVSEKFKSVYLLMGGQIRSFAL